MVDQIFKMEVEKWVDYMGVRQSGDAEDYLIPA